MASLRYLPRTILTVLVGLLGTVLASMVVIGLSRLRPTAPAIEVTARAWSRAWLWAAGAELTVEGSEHVDPARSYIVVANHVSNLDVMVCFLAVPVPIRFLAKKELFRVPVLASAMRAIGIIEIDRQARLAVHEQINFRVRQLVDAGRSLIVYPEGTRARTGSLAPFKKGAFTIAGSVGLPVLPVTIYGSYQAWPPGWKLVRGGPITAVIDRPIETGGVTQADADRLRDETHAVIARRLAELHQS